jgi:hypothetical protein
MVKQVNELPILWLAMLRKLNLLWQLWRYLGAKWLFFRLSYAIQLRTGWLEKRMPAFEWKDRPLQYWLKEVIPSEAKEYLAWRGKNRGKFFFDRLPSLPPSFGQSEIIEKANAILAGKWTYFSHTRYELSCPPNWHFNPQTGKPLVAEAHWTRIDDFKQGDIKFVWEASRFGFVYVLARAYAVNKDERYPETFWLLLEDWAKHNPPNRGANWKCGQEASFRMMAWTFALAAFSEAKSSTTERVCNLVTMIAVLGERIAKNINYARSQKNNHGISEAVGLWTIGILFPEFKQADFWREYGKRVIEEEARKQIYTDGSYIQHSNNYHRLMLHALLWAVRLGEVNNQPFSQQVYEKFSAASKFLYQVLDVESGKVPNLGSNDGALILSLNNCDYQDYRPILQSSYYLIEKKHLFESGLWDEDLLWLFGEAALKHSKANCQSLDLAALIGGYYTLRATDTWVMLRAAKFIDRPSHADQLHLDLWWRGQNIACDAGTYSYNTEAPWDNSLSYTDVHNTVIVDYQNQMPKVSRFLWLNWTEAELNIKKESPQKQIAFLQASHYSHNNVLYKRAVIRLGSESWLVHDRLSGQGTHEYCLHWLFPNFNHEWDNLSNSLLLKTSKGNYWVHVQSQNANFGSHLISADESSTQGWRSLYYGDKEAALSLSLKGGADKIGLWTLFSPRKAEFVLTGDKLFVESELFRAEVWLSASEEIEKIRVENDYLEVN